MKTKYLVIIGLLTATFAACSRDEESLFDKPAAIRAQEAIENAFDVLTSQEAGWEMAYFPNLENTAKGYNIVVKFKKDGSVSATAKNSTTTMNKIVTDSASTWQVKSDYGPILSFDTYNKVLHAWADPGTDGSGLLGDYEFLILKATPELVLLKGKKHSAYSVLRPVKNPDVAAYFTASEKMQKLLFGNNNIVTLTQGNEKMYLYNGASGQFMSAPYGCALDEATATLHPVCSTEDGIVVSTGFGDDVHDHVFLYDSIKGELKSEKGAVMNAGNLNILFGAYFTDNALGWKVDYTVIDSVETFLEQVNAFAKDTKNNANIKLLGYGYNQSLNKYEGSHFILLQFAYKKQGKGKEQIVKLAWKCDLTVDANNVTITNVEPNDDTTVTWLTNIPVIQSIIDNMVGTFKLTPGANIFNATTGMYLTGEHTLPVTGVNNVSI